MLFLVPWGCIGLDRREQDETEPKWNVSAVSSELFVVTSVVCWQALSMKGQVHNLKILQDLLILLEQQIEAVANNGLIY